MEILAWSIIVLACIVGAVIAVFSIRIILYVIGQIIGFIIGTIINFFPYLVGILFVLIMIFWLINTAGG